METRKRARASLCLPIAAAALLISPSSRAMTAQQAIASVRANVDLLVRVLEDNPRFAPPPLADERPVQLVIRTSADGRAGRGRVLPLRGGTLDRDRERALRVGRRPEAWLVVVDPTTGIPVWWAPLGRPAELHQEARLRSGAFSGTETTRPEGVAAVRAPFIPGGIVLRVRARPPAETVVVDEALVFGERIEDGITVLPREGTR